MRRFNHIWRFGALAPLGGALAFWRFGTFGWRFGAFGLLDGALALWRFGALVLRRFGASELRCFGIKTSIARTIVIQFLSNHMRRWS